MIAVDTNVIIRLLTRDDEAQYEAAYALFSEQNIYITTTVLLETEWVLRYAYHFAANEVLAALQGLLGLENVELADAVHVAAALEWHEQGLDFADALHLAASQQADSFVTFDRRLVTGASRLASITVRAL